MKEVFHLPCQMEYSHRRSMEYLPFFGLLGHAHTEKGATSR